MAVLCDVLPLLHGAIKKKQTYLKICMEFRM